MKIINLTITFIFLCFSAIHAQATDDFSVLEKRITTLEQNQSDRMIQLGLAELKQQINQELFEKRNTLQDEIKSTKNDLEGEIKRSKDQLEEDIKKLKDQYDLILSIGSVTILSLVPIIFSIFRWTHKEITRRIANVVEENETKIIALIKSQELENRIKQDDKIGLLSLTESASNDLRELFGSFGFQQLQSKVINDYEDIKNVDLLVFNDLGESLINQYLKNSAPESVFVAFSNKRLQVFDTRINFANSKFTLYTQVLNTLKFQRLFE